MMRMMKRMTEERENVEVEEVELVRSAEIKTCIIEDRLARAILSLVQQLRKSFAAISDWPLIIH